HFITRSARAIIALMGDAADSPIEQLLRKLSREQFVARMSSPFLFVYVTTTEPPSGFHTRVPARSSAPRPRSVIILPCVKAPGNPYPDRISIGRATNCDIVLRDSSVSKLHAHLGTTADRGYAITDLKSHNGTRVNGRPCIPDVAEPLRFGDSLQIADVNAKFVDAGLLHDLASALR
ncbi:MAG: hypothetical protein JWM53_4482, partial [bacterium]|nr:hypothetical protein [bacterium]